MKLSVSYLFSLLLVVSTVQAQINKWKFKTEAVYNTTNLDWSIAGNLHGQSPNILSELNFRNIDAVGANIDVSYNILKRLSVFANYRKLWTISGVGLDTDYNDDNRTNPSFREEFLSDRGSIISIGLGLEYHWLIKKTITVSSGILYRNFKQRLYLLNENLPQLNSTYDVNSDALGFSTHGSFALSDRICFESGIMFSLLKYRFMANWNLIDIFRQPLSFEQHANGYGVNGNVGFAFLINRNFNLHLRYILERQSTTDGIDTSYLRDNTLRRTKFNGADLRSSSIAFGFSYLL